MADDEDPWENTKRLLGADFFDRAEPTEDEVRTAFEAELEASADQGRPFSVLAFLALLRDSGVHELRPGAYFGGDQATAERMLAEHDAFRKRMTREG